MYICTKCGQKIFCLPDNARCKLSGISPLDMDECPLGHDEYDRDMCIPEMCDEYEEGEPTPHEDPAF